MICILQIYIHIRKDVEVNIKVANFAQIRQLETAYAIAKSWLNDHNFKIYGKT